MRLLNYTGKDDLETTLSARIVEAFGTPDQAIYGGGPLIAGRGFEETIVAFQKGQYLGVVGASLPEQLVVALPGFLRASLGYVLYATERFLVADSLSKEWGAHILGAHNADKTKQCGYLGWLATHELAKDLFYRHVNAFKFEELALLTEAQELPPGINAEAIMIGDLNDLQGLQHVVVDSVGAAICMAILGEPCVYLATHRWGTTLSALDYCLLVRWAKEAGVSDALCYNLDDIRAKAQQHHEGAHIDLHGLREKARRLLTEIAMPKSDNVLTSTFGPSPTPALIKGRELKLGTPFDRATHYDEAYFGDGIRFTRPDGTTEMYHGPAHSWGGFTQIAQWLRNLTPVETAPLLVDLGCGSGAFVEQANHAGFDGYGVDISAAAVARSNVKDRLVVGDVTDPDAANGALGRFTGRCDVVTALDFWEHIFVSEIDALAEGVRQLLKMGGRGFFCICTRSAAETDLTMQPGEIITKENSWLLVSGHVTIRRWRWWVGKFAEHGLEADLVSTQLFQVLREEDPGMATVKSWTARHTMFVRRTR